MMRCDEQCDGVCVLCRYIFLVAYRLNTGWDREFAKETNMPIWMMHIYDSRNVAPLHVCWALKQAKIGFGCALLLLVFYVLCMFSVTWRMKIANYNSLCCYAAQLFFCPTLHVYMSLSLLLCMLRHEPIHRHTTHSSIYIPFVWFLWSCLLVLFRIQFMPIAIYCIFQVTRRFILIFSNVGVE